MGAENGKFIKFAVAPDGKLVQGEVPGHVVRKVNGRPVFPEDVKIVSPNSHSNGSFLQEGIETPVFVDNHHITGKYRLG